MSEFAFDASVLIGRFQPFHLGHAHLLAKALELAPQVYVVLGSAFKAPSAKNPFSWEARARMISDCLTPDQRSRVHFLPVRDYYDDVLWSGAVKDALESAHVAGSRIALVGHRKDPSSYYLSLFPHWNYVAAGLCGDHNATRIRNLVFEQGAEADLEGFLPWAVQAHLKAWMQSPSFEAMREEYFSIQSSRATYGPGPFITLDALVCAEDHVLLVKRGHAPGKGLFAIPGGFLDAHERLQSGAKRELLEETGLDLGALAHEYRGFQVFDHPDRSQRGRIITHAFHFVLPERQPVLGSDDAAEAEWVPVKDLGGMEDQFFDDHFHILRCFGLV